MKARSAFAVVPGLMLSVALAACSSETGEQVATEDAASPTQEYESPAATLGARMGEYAEHYNMGHADAVGGLYTADAIFMGGDGSVLKGRQAIQGRTAEYFEALSPTLSLDVTDAIDTGDHMVGLGTWALEATPEGGEAWSSGGYYIGVYEKTDEGLLAKWVLSNYNAPPPEAMPATGAVMEAPGMGVEHLEALRSAYTEHYNLGHASMVAELYSEDAIRMPANMMAHEGRAAIEAGLEEEIAGNPTATITGIEAIQLGEVVVERGTYAVDATGEDGEAVHSKGYYLVVCRQDADGNWKLGWVIGNAQSSDI